MIQLYNVSKTYANGTKALSDISVSIGKGEFVFLVGASGAGKSTFLRLLFREELPTRGQILVAGRNIVRLRRSEIPQLRRNIGVVFQDFRLLPDRTAAENIAFALEILQYSRRETMERVQAVLDMVGLSHKAHCFPHQLSGGEQQRVAIARAIVNRPPIVIADEPTGNLDPETSWDIMQLFNEINLRGTTVIVATHAREIVNAMNRRTIALARGCVVRDDRRGVYAYEN